jgi:hypothetical protein
MDDSADGRHHACAFPQRLAQAVRIRDVAADSLDLHARGARVLHLGQQLADLRFAAAGASRHDDQVLGPVLGHPAANGPPNAAEATDDQVRCIAAESDRFWFGGENLENPD